LKANEVEASALITSLQLLAHEFLFNKEMVNSSNGKLAYAIGSMLFGCGIMALLGKWA
jgi:zinc transporter 1/2/3